MVNEKITKIFNFYNNGEMKEFLALPVKTPPKLLLGGCSHDFAMFMHIIYTLHAIYVYAKRSCIRQI